MRRRPLVHRLAAALVTGTALLAGTPALAQDDFPTGDGLVLPRLLCDRARLNPGGQATLAVVLEVEPGWHLYAPCANDTGMPPSVALELPEGVTSGPIAWPVPERHVSPGELLDHVYEGQVALLVPLAIDVDAPPSAEPIRAALRWLVCDEVCLMGAGQVSLEIEVGADGGPGAGAPLVDAARRRLPGPPPAGLAAEWSPDAVMLRLPGATQLAFLPDADCLPLSDLIADGEAPGDRLRLRRASRGSGGPRLAGVLAITDTDGVVHHHRIDFLPPYAASPPR